MDKPTLYLETTIPSYLTARLSQNLIVAAHQAITQDWWLKESGKYKLCVSQYVLDEAGEGDQDASKKRIELLSLFPILTITDEVLELTLKIMELHLFPEKAVRDISHIAISAVHDINYLLTWNCTHINNAVIKDKLSVLCIKEGWKLPSICTPEELMSEES